VRGSPTRPVEGGLAAGKSRAGRTWLTACAGAVFLAVFVFIAYEVHTGTFATGWDGRVTDVLVASRSGVWSRVFWVATLLGNASFMSAYLSAAVILFLAWGRWKAALVLAAGTGLAQVVSSVAKAVIDRPRPPVSLALIEQPGSHSLPSGHAFMTLVVAGLLVHLLFRRTGADRSPGGGPGRRRAVTIVGIAVAAVLLSLVGISRVYLGVHWASDVIAAWCLGAFWLILVLDSARRWRWDERPASDARPWLARGWRISLAAIMAVVVLVTLALTAWADPLL
jgi:membrane-associated phospholipid phosphatase